MTESAAIVLLIDDSAPKAGLVPPADSPERAAFLRWLVFLVAAIYPTFTYGDDPRKWLPDSPDANALREATDRHRERLWREVESASIHGRGSSASVSLPSTSVSARWCIGARAKSGSRANCPKLSARFPCPSTSGAGTTFLGAVRLALLEDRSRIAARGGNGATTGRRCPFEPRSHSSMAENGIRRSKTAHSRPGSGRSGKATRQSQIFERENRPPGHIGQ
jgi:hypothetical protein